MVLGVGVRRVHKGGAEEAGRALVVVEVAEVAAVFKEHVARLVFVLRSAVQAGGVADAVAAEVVVHDVFARFVGNAGGNQLHGNKHVCARFANQEICKIDDVWILCHVRVWHGNGCQVKAFICPQPNAIFVAVLQAFKVDVAEDDDLQNACAKQISTIVKGTQRTLNAKRKQAQTPSIFNLRFLVS